MKYEISCKVCKEDGVCLDNLEREEQLKRWLVPYLERHSLNLDGLLGFVFTPKLVVHQYGAEFLRRKNGESVILVSEELWQDAQSEQKSVQILQNTLQHEIAHVHNNNCLQRLTGKLLLQQDGKTEDLSLLVYRLWDEFYAARLASASEPEELVQAKMTGILTEARLLAREMNSLESQRHLKREEHLQNLFLSCMYLAGSYNGSTEHRALIHRSELASTPFAEVIATLSQIGDTLLQQYPFQQYKEFLPLAEIYLQFKEQMDTRYRPLWRRIFSPMKIGKLIIKD
jgi:hypothetical protein